MGCLRYDIHLTTLSLVLIVICFALVYFFHVVGPTIWYNVIITVPG